MKFSKKVKMNSNNLDLNYFNNLKTVINKKKKLKGQQYFKLKNKED